MSPDPVNPPPPTQLDRIEALLMRLIEALAEDEEPPPQTLEGWIQGAERDQTKGL